MFLHAYCPCSRATLHELEKLLVKFPNPGNAYCLVSYPDTTDAGANDLAKAARDIPRLQVRVDQNAEEAALFGIQASGAVLLYDAGGNLQFSGGVTPSRGHEGDNAGADSLLAAFEGDHSTIVAMPVFGCRLPSRSSSKPASSSNSFDESPK